MAKELKSPGRPESPALRQLAAANPMLPPPVMPNGGSEMINFRVASSTVDALDDAAEAEGTTRKVIITRALAAAGYPVQPADLEDRTPRRRRQRQAA